MEIFEPYKKKMLRGKDEKGNQRYTWKTYAKVKCDRCLKVKENIRIDNKNLSDKYFCNSCSHLDKEAFDDPLYWVKKVEQIYSDNYIVEQKKDVLYKGRLKLTCKKHNTTASARIADLLYAPMRYDTLEVLGPCKECKRLINRLFTLPKGKQQNTFRLYYLYFKDINMYKLGISSQANLSSRTYHKSFDLIWEYPISYDKGRYLERDLHNYFENYRYTGKEKLLKDGNTELYTINILPTLTDLTNLINSDL